MTDPAPNPPGPTPQEAALSYAAHGFRVLPIKAGEKRPPMTAWQDAATTDPDTITAWYTGLYRGCGVGIATGRESGIWVLDVDVSGDKSGAESYDALVERYGELPPTVTAVTGSGGFHYLYRMPDDFTVRNNASTRLGPGLDVRGEGGQIVAAPTIHPNGTAYRWVTGYGPDDVPVADAPAWLLDLLRDPVAAPAPVRELPDTQGDSAAEWYQDNTTWPPLLTADGWTLTKTLGNGEQQWTRPGKSGREGISATVGHNGADCLMVFTTSIPELEPDKAYSRFGYTAAMHHHGDRSAFARHIRRTMMPTTPTAPVAPLEPWDPASGTPEPDPLAFANVIHWPDFWANDHTDQQWAIYPLIPAGRAVALSAPAKAGKSTVLLTAALAAVTGKAAFGGPVPEEPIRVLYLDYEMTLEDLQERITDLGYGPEHDIDGLRYALLPSIAPLDTAAGAAEVMALVARHNPHVVIIDTFGRAVEGEENSADTVRGYYRHTGMALKLAGVAALRTDHTGKDTTKGQRGTSAKADDVDVVWQLSRTDDGVKLTRTHSRVGWVPTEVPLTYAEDGNGIVTLRSVGVNPWPAGTKEMAAELERLGVPVDMAQRPAVTAFRKAGGTGKQNLIQKAQKYRQETSKQGLEWAPETAPAGAGAARETAPGVPFGVLPGAVYKTAGQSMRAAAGAAGAAADSPTGAAAAPYKGAAAPGPEIDDPEDLTMDLYDDDGNELF